MNFWIVGLLISIAVVVVFAILGMNEIVDDLGTLMVIVGGIAVAIFLTAEIVIFINKYDCQIQYERDVQYKKDLILKGKMIATENGEAVQNWYDTATKFNRDLIEEQATIKYWGNWFTYHDSRYLEMEPINVEGYVINIPAYKLIMENR